MNNSDDEEARLFEQIQDFISQIEPDISKTKEGKITGSYVLDNRVMRLRLKIKPKNKKNKFQEDS